MEEMRLVISLENLQVHQEKPLRDRDDHQQIQHVDDLEDSEPSKRVKAKKIPPDVSQDEYDQHMLTHFPFISSRSWVKNPKYKSKNRVHIPRFQCKTNKKTSHIKSQRKATEKHSLIFFLD